jgi:KEOPS complex subunit Cgi121
MFKIIGATGEIDDIDIFLKKIFNFAKKKNISIQSLNADKIYDEIHLISAIEHAKRAFDQKTNTTNSLEMEVLLYSAGERQLKIAIPKMGIQKGNSKIAFVLINNQISDELIIEFLSILALTRNDSVLKGNKKTLENFGLTQKEIDTVNKEKYKDLILEKVALVDIIK